MNNDLVLDGWRRGNQPGPCPRSPGSSRSWMWVPAGRTRLSHRSAAGRPGASKYRRPGLSNSPAAAADDKHRRYLLESTSNIRNVSLSLYNRPGIEERAMNRPITANRRERGSGLIVVIMVVAFMLAVGMLLLTVTGTSPKASESMRLQGMAFDAAEGGIQRRLDHPQRQLPQPGHHELRRPVPDELRALPAWMTRAGRNYFRGLTDEQLVADVAADNTAANPALFSPSPWSRIRAAGSRSSSSTTKRRGRSQPTTTTASLVCIGRAPRILSSVSRSSSRWGPRIPRKGTCHGNTKA